MNEHILKLLRSRNLDDIKIGIELAKEIYSFKDMTKFLGNLDEYTVTFLVMFKPALKLNRALGTKFKEGYLMIFNDTIAMSEKSSHWGIVKKF